jgi:hypothetical protein
VPYRYRIDKTHRVVLFRATGHLTTREFLTCLKEIVRQPGFAPGFGHLVDLTRCSRIAPGSSAMLARIRDDRSMGDRLGHGRCALVSKDFFVYATTRIYKALARGGPLEVELFDDLDAARRWLGLPVARRRD